jgi:replicative DNA helicase
MDKFEEELLSAFILNKKKYLKFSIKIKPKHFRSKIYRFFFEILNDYYSKYEDPPTLIVFESEIDKKELSPEERRLHKKTIQKLFKDKKGKKLPIKYIKDNLLKKIETEEFITAIDRSLNTLEKEGLTKAKSELIKQVMLGEEDESFERTGLILRDWKARQAVRKINSEIPIEKRFVSTPYSAVNLATRGIQVSEAATIAGSTNIGKSIIACEFGVNALLEGQNVLHYSYENVYEQTAQRYDSRISEIKYDVLKYYEFTSSQLNHYQEVFDILTSTLKNDVMIVETLQDKTDMIKVDKKIRSLKMDDFDVSFLIIDSLDIMKSIEVHRDYRISRSSVYWDFKTYCRLKNIPGLTTTQLKAGARRNKKDPTSEDLAESYDKARILDIIYIVSQNEEEEKMNIVKFTLDKHRDAKRGLSFNLYKDAERMRFLEIIK